MAIVTKTIGPLHFEDLEPKRFEDLVRQLIYDFRPWRRLEATGRSGSDDGFDARGFEMVEGLSAPVEDADGDDARESETDRLWLVQCKRERTITPKKLGGYLENVTVAAGEKLYGIVFAAACDFSKTSHDLFRERCEALDVREWHLWGKAELEDKLLRPENDGLLFAYFGISLAIRRRSQRADLRARLAMKRKANRILEPKTNAHVLLRSPDATAYPYADDIPDFKERPQWMVRTYRGFTHEGLTFCVKRYFAFLSDDGESWDAAMILNDARASSAQDPWGDDETFELHPKIYKLWSDFPAQNQAWLDVLGTVSFDDVVDIDDIGDDVVTAPHVYVPFSPTTGPFCGFVAQIQSIGFDARSRYLGDDEQGRIKVFPDEYRMSSTPGSGKKD